MKGAVFFGLLAVGLVFGAASPASSGQPADGGRFPPGFKTLGLVLGAGGLGLIGLYLLRRGGDGEQIKSEIRSALSADPAQALDPLCRFLDSGGAPGEFSAQDIYTAFAASRKLDGLVSRRRLFSPAQLLDLSGSFSRAGRHHEALGLIDDAVIEHALPFEARVDEVVLIHDRAGSAEFLVETLSKKPPDWVYAFARGLRRQENNEACVTLLRTLKNKSPQDTRLMNEALQTLGHNLPRRESGEDSSRIEHSREDYAGLFRRFVEAGEFARAREIFGRVELLVPFKSDPKLYYQYASQAEKAGLNALAQEIYKKFIALDIDYEDVDERFQSLKRGFGQMGASAAPPAASEDPPTLPGGGLIADRFELGEEIGSGGMGLIFLANDRQLSRPVAVKKLRSELKAQPKEHRRFIQEAKIISQLVHPYIVGIHEIIEQNGETYLIFDYVDGKSLSQVLHEKGRLSLRDAQRTFGYVCQALECAHRNKVLHRDLKPSNIMIDNNGYVKVMDFGLARRLKETVSCITQIDTSGTPVYMAPEQHLGKTEQASDIFALGVCVYEVLTGRLPFSGPDFLAQKQRKMYPSPDSLVTGLPRELKPFMAKALDPDPKRRFASAIRFLEALKGMPPS